MFSLNFSHARLRPWLRNSFRTRAAAAVPLLPCPRRGGGGGGRGDWRQQRAMTAAGEHTLTLMLISLGTRRPLRQSALRSRPTRPPA